MGDTVNGIWNSRFKESLEQIKRLNTWLIVLNLTVIFTFIQQYVHLNNQKELLSKNEHVLDQPWEKLRPLYEHTNGLLENYTENQATPWYQLCFLTSVEAMQLKYSLPDSLRSDTSLTNAINAITYSGKALSFYNADLQRIRSAQKNLKAFDDLNALHLRSLINIFLFEERADEDGFNNGLVRARDSAIAHLNKSEKSIAEGKKPTLPPRIQERYLFAKQAQYLFSPVVSEMRLRDMRTFGDSLIKKTELISLKNHLDTHHFSTLKTFHDTHSKLQNNINEIENGHFFQIPVLNANISLLQFIVLGGFINLCIILYIFRNVWRTKVYQTQDDSLTPETMRAIYYGWTFGITRMDVFIALYTFFCCLMSIISLVIGILILKSSPKALVTDVLIALLNIIVAAIMSSYYFKLSWLKNTAVVSDNNQSTVAIKE